MFTLVLYAAAGGFLLISAVKDRKKTVASLKKAWKSLENILPQFLCILLIIGITMSILDKQTISALLGKESGAAGMAAAAVIGSITLIPGFVAFPLAGSLLAAGAGYGQLTMFVNTLMMVGVLTLPAETGYFGRKTAIKRNALALLYSVILAVIFGGLLS
jgi:uncharacterized membrane protein YraQ (UPF0718 family)